MRKEVPENKKLDECLKNYSPETLWEFLTKNHPEWLYNNNQQLNKYIQINFLD